MVVTLLVLFITTLMSTAFHTTIHQMGRRVRSFRAYVHKDIQPLLISIEGNIGAGKSTLAKKLKRHQPNWNYIDEPIDTWSSFRNANNDNLLELFYDNRKRWSYTFQNCALLTRYQNIEGSISQSLLSAPNDKTPSVFVTERCLDTDLNVFTKMLHAENSIDELELTLYKTWFAHLKKTATPLAAVIHVATTPVECLQRVRHRNRKGEEQIDIDYLKQLDRHQRDWLSSLSIPVLSSNNISEIESFVKGLVDHSLK